MKEKTIELLDGIHLHLLPTEQFKTNLVAVFMLTNLDREHVTQNALIPAVLRRGTQNLPTMKEIAIQLEEMYGAVLDASSDKMGDQQVLQFYIDSLADEYALENEPLLQQSIDLLCDVMLHPRLEKGCFCEEYVAQEKETIRELILSKINDKASYAMERAIEEMCEEEPYGLYKFGYVEDLETIQAKALYEQYQTVLATAEIHIYLSGNWEEEKMISIWKEKFEGISRHYTARSQNSSVTNCWNRVVVETQNVMQGKLVLGYRVKDVNLLDDMYTMALYSAVLGGTASSKLFMNVREKQSLAYTVRSLYLKHKGLLLVTAGIEIEQYEKALTQIQKELEDMRLGNITEEEIQDAKANLTTAYRSYLDRQSSMINFYMGQRYLGTTDDIDTMIEKLNAVTKEEIVALANRLELQITYFLTNSDAEKGM